MEAYKQRVSARADSAEESTKKGHGDGTADVPQPASKTVREGQRTRQQGTWRCGMEQEAWSCPDQEEQQRRVNLEE